jgi:hypothetical protein
MAPPPQTIVHKWGANHGLHVVLTILTCGVWAITGWPIAAAMGRKTRTTMYPGQPQQGYYPPPGPQQGWGQPPAGHQPPGYGYPPAQQAPPPGYGYPPQQPPAGQYGPPPQQ